MRPGAPCLRLIASLSATALLFASTLEGTALAQEEGEQDAPPAAPAPPQRLPPNIRVSPQGDVSVTRTPEQGVDVHAQTTAGTVHAYGCNRVAVDPRTARPGAPCTAPYPYPYPPPPPAYYPQQYAPPAYYSPPPAYYAPPPPPDYDARPQKPKPPPDPARKAALIASSLVFSIGTVAAGTAYLVSLAPAVTSFQRREPSKPALFAMGAFLTVPPSVPRYVVGHVGVGLLFTAIRGASFAAGTLIDWEDATYMLPVTMTLVVPLTLGIVDLATTPRRNLKRQPAEEPTETASLRLLGVAPTVAMDSTGARIPAVSAIGTF